MVRESYTQFGGLREQRLYAPENVWRLLASVLVEFWKHADRAVGIRRERR
jgi:hypothetical protein